MKYFILSTHSKQSMEKSLIKEINKQNFGKSKNLVTHCNLTCMTFLRINYLKENKFSSISRVSFGKKQYITSVFS